MTIVTAAFLLGVLGSAHCVGMCGPFAMGITRMGAARGRPARSLAAYLSGKTLTYALLGLIVGGAGALLLEAIGGLQRSISLGVGALLVLTGVIMLVGPRALSSLGSPVTAGLSRAMGHLVRRTGGPSHFLLGALNGLLPCGLVVGALLLAASTGSVWMGALTMTVFGFATVPALAVMGAGSEFLMRSRWRNQFARAGALMIVLIGLLTMARGSTFMDALMPHDHAAHGTEQVEPSTHPHH